MGAGAAGGRLADTWYILRRYMRRTVNAVGMVTSAARALLRLNDVDIATHMADADAILKANLALQASQTQCEYVRNHFRYFFDRMGLYELSIDGELNVDPVSIAVFSRPAQVIHDTVPTLSVEYLEFLRTIKHFVAIHGNAFISLKGFIDLARCPILFSIDVDAAGLLIASLLRLDTDAQDVELAEWRQQRAGQFEAFFDNYRVTPLLVFDRYELLRTALMRFRCCFALSNERDSTRPAEHRQRLREYFDMELVPWLEKLYEGANLDTRQAYPNVDSWKSAMIENILPAKSVRDLIVENAKLTVAKGEVDHQHQAQQLDLFYANLVHGAGVRIPLQEIWCPHNEMEHSESDSEEFFKIMWKALKDVLDESVASLPVGSSAADATNRFVSSIRNVKEAKKIMKEVWEKSKSYRISDKVHMIEVELLQRLKRDDAFPWIDGHDKAKISTMHACFFLRRHEHFRYAFAAAVGKRFYTERLSGLQKGNIIDHQRSVQWAETEYATLYNLINDGRSKLHREMVDAFNSDDALFNDYSGMMAGARAPSLSVGDRLRWNLS